MATQNYEESLRLLLKSEGGYTNHPRDPGGPTNFGITLNDYRKYIKSSGTASDVRDMTVEQAKSIYRTRYWDSQSCDKLPAGVDYCIFDYGVNSGIGRSGKVLKRVMGLDASSSVITASTIAEANKRDPKALVNAICNERMMFLKGLETWDTFGLGWTRRVNSVRAVANRMAEGRQAAAPPVALPVPGKGTVPEPKVTKEVIRTGAPVGTAMAGATFFDWVSTHIVPSIIIVCLVVGAIAFGLNYLKKRREEKQEAPVLGIPVIVEMPPSQQPPEIGR